MPVCIAGMHRSGTSMVARLLHLCGLYLGDEKDLHGPGPANPEGFWENWQFVNLNDEILKCLGLGWDLPFDAPAGWESSPQLEPLRVQATAVIEPFRYSELWGWKDPRNSLTLPFWRALVPGLRLVICLRNPVEVAESLRVRGSSSMQFGFNLWLSYYRQLLATCCPQERVITHYDAYFSDCRQELRRITRFLGIDVPDDVIEQACSVVKKGLRHRATVTEGLSKTHAPDDVVTLYEALCTEGGPVYQTYTQHKMVGGTSTSTPINEPCGHSSALSVIPVQTSLPVEQHAASMTSNVVSDQSVHVPQETLDISVIILNYNGCEHLEPCLSSLLSTDYPNAHLEIIVVDNGSTDGSVDLLKRMFPHVRLIQNHTNLGFSKAANIGAAAARGEFLTFLNNDMRVDKGWLRPLLEAILSDSTVACVGSVILNWEGTAPNFIGRPNDAFCLDYRPSASPPPSPLVGSDAFALFVSGGATMIRSEVFKELGGFDPDFFLYHEDVDLGWRLWLRGYKCLLSSKSIVYHRGGASSGKLPPEYIQGLSQKHTLFSVFKNLDDGNLRDVLPLLLYFFHERGDWVPAVYHSLGTVIQEFHSSLDSLIMKRAEVQKTRVRTDAEIFSVLGHPFSFLLRQPHFESIYHMLRESCLRIAFDPDEAESSRIAITEWLKVVRLQHEKHLAARLHQTGEAVSALQTQMAAKEETLRVVSEQIAAKDAQLAQQEHAVATLRAEVTEKEEALQVVMEQIAAKDAQLAQQEHAVATLRAEVTEKEEALQVVMEQTMAKDTQLAQQGKAVAALQAQMKPRAPSLLISASSLRSGSTWVQRIAHAATDIFVWGEPFPLIEWLCYVFHCFQEANEVRVQETRDFLSRSQDPTVWTANINPPLDSLIKGVQALFSEYYREPHGRARYGWKEVRYGQCELEFLWNLFPDLRVVLLVRNPIDVIRSLRGKGWIGHGQDTHSLEWVCRSWSRHTQDYLSLRNRPNTLFLRYEDVASSVNELLAFIGGELSEQVRQALNAVTGSTNKLPLLSSQDLSTIIDICSNEMEILGYLTVDQDQMLKASRAQAWPDSLFRKGAEGERNYEYLVSPPSMKVNEAIAGFAQMALRDEATQRIVSYATHLKGLIAASQAELAAKEKTLRVLSEQNAAKDAHLAQQGQAVVAKQTQMAAKEQTIRVVSEQNAAKDAHLAQQEEAAAALLTQMAAKEQTIWVLSEQIAVKDAQIERITGTLGWRILSYFGPIKHGVLLPLYRLLKPSPPKSPPLPSIVTTSEGSGQITTIPLSDPEEQQPHSRPSSFDIIMFPIINWEFRFQRPQQIAVRFARADHRVFYARTSFAEHQNPTTRSIQERVFEVQLPGPSHINLYSHAMDEGLEAMLSDAFASLRQEFNIVEAVCFVNLPFWRPIALRLRERFGWKIVYDCMDYHRGFSGTAEPMLMEEEELSLASDLVLTSSRPLFAAQSAHNPNCVLVPNATDLEHFNSTPHPLPGELSTLVRPIIGYYGAISDWFDCELIRELALARPQWSFVLIGRTFGADLAPLRHVRNVHLLGEKPYPILPPYLHAFDICVIPFKKTPLTDMTNPVKLFEFLSAGKAVVATDLTELRHYADYVELASTLEQWLLAIEKALHDYSSERVAARVEFARRNTWDERVLQIAQHIIPLYPKVSIIIVTHNNLDYTRLCLESIYKKTIYPNYEVIVVDNASTDSTAEFLEMFEATHPTFVPIFNEMNEGFAAANNRGIATATGEYIVFLNNDTIVTRGWLSGLINHLRDVRVGIVGPVTNFSGNESRIEVDYRTPDEIESFAERYTCAYEGQTFEISMLALFCVAMRRSIVDEVGLLDERFGIGMFEDDDYALRVRQKGYKVICAEDVFVHHWGRASFSKLNQDEYQRLFDENRRKFEEKWDRQWEPHRYRSGSQES